jgi:hypothetical protein
LKEIRDPLPVGQLQRVKGIGEKLQERLLHRYNSFLSSGGTLEQVYGLFLHACKVYMCLFLYTFLYVSLCLCIYIDTYFLLSFIFLSLIGAAFAALGTEVEEQGELTRLTKKSRSSKQSGGSQPAKAKKPRRYIPAPRSGGYGILIALYRAQHERRQSLLTRNELQQHAQPYCDASFKDPTNGFYTAWASMRGLLEKG